MNFQFTEASPISLSHMVGVAICVTHIPLQMMHVGLTYMNSDAAARFIHLAGHLDLKDEDVPADNYFWADCGFLSRTGYETHAEHVANLLEAISIRREIPYGLDATDVRFSPDGTYVSVDAARGLTCATFIAAVFQSAGLPVVMLETWESRNDDDRWRQIIIEYMKREHPARAVEIAGSPGAYRLRPDEIAVASAGMTPPLSFHDARSAALPLRAQLFPPDPPI